MTDQKFALFDTAIGRCAIAWSERGINAVRLPMPDENKTRMLIRKRYGDIDEAPPPARCRPRSTGSSNCSTASPSTSPISSSISTAFRNSTAASMTSRARFRRARP